jgi:hypothetical protein
MDGKRELLEDVYGCVPQRLCDLAKAGVPAASSPAVEPHPLRYHVYHPMLSACLASRVFQTPLWPMGEAP